MRVLLLLCAAAIAGAVLNMEKYFVPSNLCVTDIANVRTLQYFNARFGPLPPVTVNGGELLVSYPTTVHKDYSYEGTRFNASRCSFCPYSAEAPRPEYFFAGGVRNRHIPMYGPCLDGLESIRMPCVQNLVLYPPDFVGEYFFPEQRIADPLLIAFPYFAHEWVEGTYTTSIQNQDSPTNYALGRGNALTNIQTLRVVNNASGVENTTISALLQAPYINDEQWPKWEQHFCRQGCHRDSQHQLVTVRPSDYQVKNIHDVLWEYILNATTGQVAYSGVSKSTSHRRRAACSGALRAMPTAAGGVQLGLDGQPQHGGESGAAPDRLRLLPLVRQRADHSAPLCQRCGRLHIQRDAVAQSLARRRWRVVSGRKRVRRGTRMPAEHVQHRLRPQAQVRRHSIGTSRFVVHDNPADAADMHPMPERGVAHGGAFRGVVLPSAARADHAGPRSIDADIEPFARPHEPAPRYHHQHVASVVAPRHSGKRI